MSHDRQATMKVKCQVTGKDISLNEAVPVDLVRESLIPILEKMCPNLDRNGYISMAELDKARIVLAEDIVQREMGDLAKLKKEVSESLLRQETITKDIDKEFDANATRGEKIADKVAAFGGSWAFIILFLTIMFVWMGINTALFLAKPFDPFPYIFLNLVLSCLAAIQAPVIMMSQNRQEAKDRVRSEHDFKTNLKAELEIQGINEKVDKLINDQWKHLLEIQQMQMEMIEQIAKR
ncbi:MAG TPA: DUF1003 domain-containing protein [Fimbriimonadaceae bacterium]|jgi:uncharacterized membrane protein